MDVNPAEAIPPADEKKDESTPLDALVGISVVLLATFLGIASVKSGNIGQQMEKAQSDRNNDWLWFQARNLREEMYRTAADHLRAQAGTQPSPELLRMIETFDARARDQEAKKQKQFDSATSHAETYEALGGLDDQFDVTEAALTIGLALMGVTALMKRYWLFILALVPSGFGVFMGIAGFAGWVVSLEDIPGLGAFFRMIL